MIQHKSTDLELAIDYLAEVYENYDVAKKSLKIQMIAAELVAKGFSWKDI